MQEPQFSLKSSIIRSFTLCGSVRFLRSFFPEVYPLLLDDDGVPHRSDVYVCGVLTDEAVELRAGEAEVLDVE